MIKSCQFFRFYKRFYKEREKALIHLTLNEDKKMGKGGLYFVTDCFTNPFKVIINHFYSFLLDIWNT